MDYSENDRESPSFACDLINIKSKTHGNKQDIYHDQTRRI